MSPIKRILFDLDGTLFDTQCFHGEAEAALLAEYGVLMHPDELAERFAGIPTEIIFMTVLGCDEKTAHALAVRKWPAVFSRVKEAAQLHDLVSLFARILDRGVALSIGTGSPTQWARDLLHENDLTNFFTSRAVIGVDLVTRGKPHPDIWLMAAQGTPSENCLVVEDGIAGIQGAIAAGMRCALLLPREYPTAMRIKKLDDILALL